MGLTLNAGDARKGDSITNIIRESGKYVGIITRAEKLVSKNRVEGLGLSFKTDDGATIFVQYHGRSDASRGLPATVYVAPRFETSDERYVWLNRVQAIGKGILYEDLSLDYEWYEAR